MRPNKQNKIKKSETRTKACKKNNARKINRSCRLNDDLSTTNIENINEVLRIQKAQRVKSKGSWKLVPKDSCEVYKERRKKKLESRQQHSNESLSEDSQKRTRRDKTRPKENDKRVKKKPNKNARKKRCRPDSQSSVPSRPSSCSSMSTSCASTSDMEY